MARVFGTNINLNKNELQNASTRKERVDVGKPRTYRYKIIDGRKQCIGCSEWKDIEGFREIGNTLDGRIRVHPRCFPCETEYYRIRHLANKWGMTVQEHQSEIESQNGVCYLCQKLPKDGFVIDHNHATGAKRKLLCKTCNWGLGSFQDDPDLLRKAANYLEKMG